MHFRTIWFFVPVVSLSVMRDMRNMDESWVSTEGKIKSPEKQLFNPFYRSTRRIIENAIGAWKMKVPLLNIGLYETNLEK